MLKDSLLPADSFVVVNKTILTEQDRNILIMLYQPIIGSYAISLYFTLWSYLDRNQIMSEEWTHHHLMTNMRIKLDNIKEAREKLEGIGLLKTYVKTDKIKQFVYELYSPVSVTDFINNPVLDTTLYNNVGNYEYEKIMNFFKLPKINLSSYEDITCHFNDVFESVNINTIDHDLNDFKKSNIKKLEISAKIDIDSIISSIPEQMLNPRSLTRDTKELLYRISFIYNFDDDKMVEIIRNSLTDKRTIDKNLLRQNSKKIYQYNHYGKLPNLMYRNQPEYLRKATGEDTNKAKLIYQFEVTTPYDFLLSKYSGNSLSKQDISILEFLLLDMNLKPGVVNVLIDYVLKTNNNKLTKAYIETIASQWSRSKIETVEQAMNIAEKEYKNRIKFKEANTIKTKVIENKPEWFEHNIGSSKASEIEEEEMKKLLSEFK